MAHNEENQFEPSEYTILNWVGYSGRGGDIEGMFGVDSAGLERLRSRIGTTIYMGEVLGKHSDVYFDLKWGQFTTIANGPEAASVARILGTHSFGGFNPMDYDECRECGDTWPEMKCTDDHCVEYGEK